MCGSEKRPPNSFSDCSDVRNCDSRSAVAMLKAAASRQEIRDPGFLQCRNGGRGVGATLLAWATLVVVTAAFDAGDPQPADRTRTLCWAAVACGCRGRHRLSAPHRHLGGSDVADRVDLSVEHARRLTPLLRAPARRLQGWSDSEVYADVGRLRELLATVSTAALSATPVPVVWAARVQTRDARCRCAEVETRLHELAAVLTRRS